MLRQRVYGLALGYEDLNDHDQLRKDLALQTATERDTDLASAPTLCRLENRADRNTAWALHRWGCRVLLIPYIFMQQLTL